MNNSYTPSVQSMQLMFRRAALDLAEKGDTTMAVELADKYFESFPDMNFPYDYRTNYLLQVYYQAGAPERAKPHAQVLADRLVEYMNFYETIDPNVLSSSYRNAYSYNFQTMEELLQYVSNSGDSAFHEELKQKFAPFRIDQAQQPELPPPSSSAPPSQ